MIAQCCSWKSSHFYRACGLFYRTCQSVGKIVYSLSRQKYMVKSRNDISFFFFILVPPCPQIYTTYLDLPGLNSRCNHNIRIVGPCLIGNANTVSSDPKAIAAVLPASWFCNLAQWWRWWWWRCWWSWCASDRFSPNPNQQSATDRSRSRPLGSQPPRWMSALATDDPSHPRNAQSSTPPDHLLDRSGGIGPALPSRSGAQNLNWYSWEQFALCNYKCFLVY